jgi:hypothetical protein
MAKAKFHPAPELAEVAEGILARPDCQEHLMVLPECRITYLFMEGPETSSWSGRCYRTTGPYQHLSNFDFVVVAFKKWWEDASHHAREAMVFHELMHVGYTINQKGETSWSLQDHFVETFPEEIRIFGCWNPILEELRNSVVENEKLASSISSFPE